VAVVWWRGEGNRWTGGVDGEGRRGEQERRRDWRGLDSIAGSTIDGSGLGGYDRRVQQV
jgi:hypothetical protein